MSDDESSVDTKVSVYFNSGEVVLLHRVSPNWVPVVFRANSTSERTPT